MNTREKIKSSIYSQRTESLLPLDEQVPRGPHHQMKKEKNTEMVCLVVRVEWGIAIAGVTPLSRMVMVVEVVWQVVDAEG